ncbi:MAG: DNA topoisomerase I [Candidatus Micrarchaeota archaeon]
MQLIISEKAIAGERIASILAGKNVLMQREDFAQMFSFQKGNREFLVIPLRGHISNVDFPKKYSYWRGTDLKELALAPIEYVATEKAIVALLKKKAVLADSVVIATDADREGESIGVEALNYIKESNPKILESRAYFSAMTPKEITEAFEKPVKVDYHFADSADCRREVDLIWGACLTRFVSLMAGRMGKDFLSVGRVQTPVLALIVDREKERRAFQTRKYWIVRALFEKDSVKFEAEHKKGKLWNKEEADEILKSKDLFGVVSQVDSKQRVLEKPVPFSTTRFLRQATVLGLTAGEAMNIAESLYQQGFTSYPRTDNETYPPSLDLDEILGELSKVPDFAPLVQKIRLLGKLNPSKGKETKDHPPIHPVAFASKERLTEKQWRVYELICRRFLATLAEEAVTLNTRVELLLKKEPFIANGQVIQKLGWKEFYPYSSLEETILPKLEKGDQARLLDLTSLEKQTLPPPRYSQSALIKLMEENNLGTKSTRHSILQKLYERRYISGLKAIEPNEIAFSVISSLQKNCKKVTEPKLTADLEAEMDEIASGAKAKSVVVSDSRKWLLEVLEQLLKNKDEVALELRKGLRNDSILGKCTRPDCPGQLIMRFGKTKKRFLGCTEYPKCTTTYPLPQLGRLAPTSKSCDVCGVPVIRVTGQRGSFEMCVNMNCATKDEWKKKSAERLAAKAAEGLKAPAAAVPKTPKAKTVKPKKEKSKKVSAKKADEPVVTN